MLRAVESLGFTAISSGNDAKKKASRSTGVGGGFGSPALAVHVTKTSSKARESVAIWQKVTIPRKLVKKHHSDREKVHGSHENANAAKEKQF